MHYRISAKINKPGQGIAHVWYAGRSIDGPHFETDVMHSKVLRYYYLENVESDKAFLEGIPELCQDVEIVTFDEEGQLLNDDTAVLSNATTVELQNLSTLEILKNVQEILTQMITPGIHAQTDQEIAHEQVRTALSLVLRAISNLKKEKKHN